MNKPKYNAYIWDHYGLNWVWSTQSRWKAPHACTPKAVSFKTAEKQIAFEMSIDPMISRSKIVPVK